MRISTSLVLAAALAGVGLDASADVQGFLYGKVTMRSGDVYQGRLRWGAEEAFWDDLFNSAKEELTALDYLPSRDRGRSRVKIDVLGIDIGANVGASRQFQCRFGDISKIEVTGEEQAELTMRDGTHLDVSGSSNDVSAEITVWDQGAGDIELRWNRIDTIEFLTTPGNLDVESERLRGKVETEAGPFEGFIQWDSQECLTTDKLDGESEDGKVALPMGQIEQIDRRHDSVTVKLRDGRSLDLSGTNDVNSSLRGILIEEPRYGRIEVSWDAFESLTFLPPGPSGPSYDSFGPGKKLDAAVTDADGEVRTGRIYFDLDEEATWEMLNGSEMGISYNIPFSAIRTVEPLNRRSSRITLANGEKLRLEESQDVGERNDGILLFLNADDDDPVYLSWRDVELIELR